MVIRASLMKEDRSHRCGCCSNCYFLNRFCLSTLLPHKWQVLIQVTATGQPIVIGIMSKNQGCDNLNIPTTYTRYWTFFPYFFFLQNISLFDFFFLRGSLVSYYSWFRSTAGVQPTPTVTTTLSPVSDEYKSSEKMWYWKFNFKMMS